MLRHEGACDAANKTSKERGGFGFEEVHPGEPYGRPNAPPEPEEQADSERRSHRAHMGLCRRGNSRRRPSGLFFGGGLPLSWRIGRDRPPSSATAYRSPGGSDGIGLQCVGSHSTSTLAVDIQRPFLPLPCLLWPEEDRLRTGG